MARASATAPAESVIQEMVVQACRLQRDERRDVIHVPNEGKRSCANGARLKRQGLQPGVHDLLIPAKRMGKCGLWLELKAKGKKPTPDQRDFGRRMIRNGYCAAWADSFDGAMAEIEQYMHFGSVSRVCTEPLPE